MAAKAVGCSSNGTVKSVVLNSGNCPVPTKLLCASFFCGDLCADRAHPRSKLKLKVNEPTHNGCSCSLAWPPTLRCSRQTVRTRSHPPSQPSSRPASETWSPRWWNNQPRLPNTRIQMARPRKATRRGERPRITKSMAIRKRRMMVFIVLMRADMLQTFSKGLLWIPQYATCEFTMLTTKEIDATHSRIKSLRSLNLARFTKLQVLETPSPCAYPRNSDYETTKSHE
jgi:hypothetical protein